MRKSGGNDRTYSTDPEIGSSAPDRNRTGITSLEGLGNNRYTTGAASVIVPICRGDFKRPEREGRRCGLRILRGPERLQLVPGTGGDNIKRCIALIILAVVCTGNGAFGQNSAGGVEQSVVAVLDLSYSMRLTESSGATRLEILKGGLRSIFERPVAGVEWAIIGFDDTDSIQLYQPFTTDHGALLGVLREVGSGRLSPVGDALSRAAAYLRGNARSVDGKVLLVSDGISTGGVGFGFRLSEEYAKRRIPLFILGFPHESNPSLRESLGLIASHTGGSYYTFDAVGDLRRELLQPWSLVHGLSNGSALAASASGAPNGGGRL